MKRTLFSLLLVFAASVSLSAQNIVKGTVLDAEGNPVIGAAVYVQNTSQGSVTDVDGNTTVRTADAVGDQAGQVLESV